VSYFIVGIQTEFQCSDSVTVKNIKQHIQ